MCSVSVCVGVFVCCLKTKLTLIFEDYVHMFFMCRMLVQKLLINVIMINHFCITLVGFFANIGKTYLVCSEKYSDQSKWTP